MVEELDQRKKRNLLTYQFASAEDVMMGHELADFVEDEPEHAEQLLELQFNLLSPMLEEAAMIGLIKPESADLIQLVNDYNNGQAYSIQDRIIKGEAISQALYQQISTLGGPQFEMINTGRRLNDVDMMITGIIDRMTPEKFQNESYQKAEMKMASSVQRSEQLAGLLNLGRSDTWKQMYPGTQDTGKMYDYMLKSAYRSSLNTYHDLFQKEYNTPLPKDIFTQSQQLILNGKVIPMLMAINGVKSSDSAVFNDMFVSEVDPAKLPTPVRGSFEQLRNINDTFLTKYNSESVIEFRVGQLMEEYSEEERKNPKQAKLIYAAAVFDIIDSTFTKDFETSQKTINTMFRRGGNSGNIIYAALNTMFQAKTLMEESIKGTEYGQYFEPDRLDAKKWNELVSPRLMKYDDLQKLVHPAMDLYAKTTPQIYQEQNVITMSTKSSSKRSTVKTLSELDWHSPQQLEFRQILQQNRADASGLESTLRTHAKVAEIKNAGGRGQAADILHQLFIEDNSNEDTVIHQDRPGKVAMTGQNLVDDLPEIPSGLGQFVGIDREEMKQGIEELLANSGLLIDEHQDYLNQRNVETMDVFRQNRDIMDQLTEYEKGFETSAPAKLRQGSSPEQIQTQQASMLAEYNLQSTSKRLTENAAEYTEVQTKKKKLLDEIVGDQSLMFRAGISSEQLAQLQSSDLINIVRSQVNNASHTMTTSEKNIKEIKKQLDELAGKKRQSASIYEVFKDDIGQIYDRLSAYSPNGLSDKQAFLRYNKEKQYEELKRISASVEQSVQKDKAYTDRVSSQFNQILKLQDEEQRKRAVSDAQVEIFFKDAQSLGLTIQRPAEGATIQQVSDHYQNIIQTLQMKQAAQEQYLRTAAKIGNSFNQLIEGETQARLTMARAIESIKAGYETMGQSIPQEIINLQQIELRDPQFQQKFDAGVRAAMQVIANQKSHADMVQSKKLVYESMNNKMSSLFKMQEMMRENWEGRGAAFNAYVQQYNTNLPQVLGNDQQLVQQFTLPVLQETHSAAQWRELQDGIQERMNNLQVHQHRVNDQSQTTQGLLSKLQQMQKMIQHEVQERSEVQTKITNLISQSDYIGKPQDLSSIRSIDDYTSELAKMSSYHQNLIHQNQQLRAETLNINNQIHGAGADKTEQSRLERELRVKRLELEGNLADISSGRKAISDLQIQTQIINKTMTNIIQGKPADLAKLAKEKNLKAESLISIQAAVDASAGLWESIQASLNSDDVDVKNTMEILVKNKVVVEDTMRLKLLSDSIADIIQTPLVRGLQEATQNISSKLLQKLFQTTHKIKHLDIMKHTRESGIDRDTISNELQILHRDFQTSLSAVVMNRTQQQTVLRLLENVYFMESTGSGRAFLRNNFKYDSATGAGQAMSKIVSTLQDQMIYLDMGDGVGSIQKFNEFIKFSENALKPALEKINSVLISEDMSSKATQAMSAMTLASKQLAELDYAKIGSLIGNQMRDPNADHIRQMQGVRDLSQVYQHLFFSYGANIFEGVPTNVLNNNQLLQDETNRLIDKMDIAGLLDPNAIKSVVGNTVGKLTKIFTTDIIAHIGDKFGSAQGQIMEGMSDKVLSNAVKQMYDVNAKAEVDLALAPGQQHRHLTQLKSLFDGGAQDVKGYVENYNSIRQRLDEESKAPRIADIVPLSDRQIRSNMDKAALKQVGMGDVPFAANILGKRPGASIYDGGMNIHQFNTVRSKIQRIDDPNELARTKARAKAAQEQIMENAASVAAPYNAQDQVEIQNAREQLRRAFQSKIFSQVYERGDDLKLPFMAPKPNWGVQEMVHYHADLLRVAPRAFANLYAPILENQNQMFPITKQQKMLMSAFIEEFEGAMDAVYGPGNLHVNAINASGLSQRDQLALTTRLSHLNGLQAGLRKNMTSFRNVITDMENYSKIYDGNQLLMVDAINDLIADQEIRNGNAGQLNEAMRKASHEAERMAFEMMRKGGLDDVPRQMQDRQARMVAQAGQAIRGGVLPPSLYQRQQQQQTGHSGQSFSSMRQFNAQQQVAQESGQQTQKQKSEQNREEDQKNGILPQQTFDFIAQLGKINQADLQFLAKIKRVDGRLKIVDDQKNAFRELDDEEKMRACRILILIMVLLFRTYFDDMTEQDIKEKKKDAESKLSKGSAGKNVNGLSQYINQLVNKVK